jgi:hypothetical protein
MSVIMMLQLQGDPEKLEQFAQENEGHMRSIIERAKENGVIAHRFYGSDGRILVVDEWPDEESFQRFFESAQGEIGPIMQAAAVEGDPAPTFWRKLDTRDDVGWD